MSEREWTKEQENAITARDGSVLVSAAAGSGKTAVLVERVVERVCNTENPCPVDELLVVTFTQAAAAEMKERINMRLTELLRVNPENKFLIKQKILLPSAEICTIDKFCNMFVKRNFSKLGITPDFRILDQGESKILSSEAAGKVIEELYEENSSEFRDLCELFISGRTDEKLESVILKIYENSCAYAFPKRWINNVLSLYNPDLSPQNTQWGQVVLKDILTSLKYYVSSLEKCTDILVNEPELAAKYMPAINSDIKYYKKTYKCAKSGDWDKTKVLFDNFSPERFQNAPKSYKDSPEKDYVKVIRDKTKAAFKKLSEEMPVSTEEFKEDTKALRAIMVKLFGAVNKFSECYSELKSELNAFDFSDISHMALSLLVSGTDENGNCIRTELAQKLQQNYREILIDEYQDTNRAQDMLFSALSNNEENLFFVGDVKQSIYGFRLAMPEIFVERRNARKEYIKDNYPSKITLDMNFRSRKGVTECINHIFSRIMSKDMGGVDYDGTERLAAKDDYLPCDFPNAELHLVDISESEESDDLNEAQHIADTIKEIIDSKMPVKSKNGYRPVQHKDICILMRSVKNADVYSEVLKNNGIPVFFQNGGGFFSATEINVMLSFLQIIDNPLQDIPVLAVLMSPVFGFTPDDLAKIRIKNRNGFLFHGVIKSDDEKCKRFTGFYNELRNLSTVLSVERLLRTIYERTAYISMVGAMPDGETRRLNLLLLLQYASDYEKNSQPGVSGFIRYMNKLKDGKNDLGSAVGVSEYANVVKIISIHASKGLEFPIVILCKCGKKLNTTDQNERLIIDPTTKLGVGTKRIIDNGTRIFPTVQHTACKLSLRDSSRAEELRVLYVALTRAKERLIMVGTSKNIENTVSNCALSISSSEKIETALISKAQSYLEILIMSLLTHKDAKPLRTMANIFEDKASPSDFHLKVLIDYCNFKEIEIKENKIAIEYDEKLLEEVKNRTSYKYEFSESSNYASKISASSFNRENVSGEYFITAMPSFICKNQMTPAMRGTATHRLLEICDMDNCKIDIDGEISLLTENGKLTQQQGQAINKQAIKAFFNSNLYKRMSASKQIYKEQKFTLLVPIGSVYDDVSSNISSEKIVVQGIIDCLFIENGEIVVVDYKTDRVNSEDELKEKYLPQMKMYKRAAQEIFNLPVKEILIYSLSLEKDVKLYI